MEGAQRSPFGEVLATFRTRAKLSQQQLAKQLGKDRRSVAAWEGGEYLPKHKGDLLEVARILARSDEETILLLTAAGIDPALPLWNVPYHRNRYFTGRETVLEQLRQRLVPGAKTTALTQSISGLGGVGKTQVAVEYAHLYGKYYTAVLWMPADSLEIATAACLQLATEVLGLPEQQEAEQQIAAVKNWLQQKRQNWLLIFDNVEDPTAILSTFVPTQHQGSILITTRRRDVGTLAHSEVLPLFSVEESVLFLLRRVKRIAEEAEVTEATADDSLLVRALCRLLGWFPLALDQAGAYIAENGCSLQDYIDLYDKFRPVLLDRRSGSDHPDSVLITFWLSWEQIQQRNILAGRALQFCAFLAPDQIPEQLVLDGRTYLETESTGNALELNEALGLLYRYSLIERSEQTLSLHRLVQEVMQEVLSEEEQQHWMERAALVVNTLFPSGEYGTWSLCERLLPHALVCSKWILILKQRKSEAVRLLSATGRYLYERAQYKEAESLLKGALSIREEQLGTEHPDAATSLNDLAELYRLEGRYGEAEPLYQRALFTREEQLGAEHPNTAECLNNLALLYESQGRYGEAEPLYQRALLITEKQLGTEHLHTAECLNNLALLYESQGRYGEAEPLYQRVLLIAEKQLGGEHPFTALCLNNLAELYRQQSRYKEAEPLYQRALFIREEQSGPEHPDTATCLNNLALLYKSQGRYGEAESLFKRALLISEKHLGLEHPDTAISLHNLALLYESQGRYGEAESLFKRALLIAEKHLSSEHRLTVTCLNNLAKLYWIQGRYEEAKPLYRQALKVSHASLGEKHPLTQSVIAGWSNLLSSEDIDEELKPLIQISAQREPNGNVDGENAQK